MKHCHILTKLSDTPKILEPFTEDTDILFSWTEAFVVVNDEDELPYPYEYELPIELIRIDKRVLRDLEDDELAIVLFRAKIERELYLFLKDDRLITEAVEDVLTQRYPKQTLQRLEQKLEHLFSVQLDLY